MSRSKSRKASGRAGAPSSVHRIERSELRAFDAEATGMILEAMELGCLGRVSANGHAIVYNNAGDSASVARKMSTVNRTSQNSRSDMRRILSVQAAQAALDESAFGAIASPCSRILTVSQAFVDDETGAAFSQWFDRQDGRLAPDDRIEVTTRPGAAPGFELLPRIVTEQEAPREKTDRQPGKIKEERTMRVVADDPDGTAHVCDVCGKGFPSGRSLGGHMSTHRGPIPATEPAPRKKAAKKAPKDPAEVLEAVRALLGEDPRVAELQAAVSSLEAELAAQTKRADDALARLSLIEEAFHA